MKEQQVNMNWLSNLVEGEKEAFDSVYHRYKAAIFFFARKRLDNTDEAEDVTANAFYKLWKYRHAMKNPAHVRSYLYQVVVHECTNLNIRNQRKIKALHNVPAITEESVDPLSLERVQAEMIALIFEEVQQLPGRMREVFSLIFFEQLTPQEVADKLKIDRQTVYKHRSEALRILKAAFTSKGLEAAFLYLLFWGGDV